VFEKSELATDPIPLALLKKGKQTMTWKRICPIVQLNQNVYEKGVALSKTAMKAIEQRLQFNPELPKWDILIQPLI